MWSASLTSIPVNLPAVRSSVTGALSAVAVVWIFALMVLICADVIGLKFFNSPIYGVIEIVEYSIVPIVFLQFSDVVRTGRLTRADFLYGPMQKLYPLAASVLEALFMLAGAVVFALLARELFSEFRDAYSDGDYVGSAGIFSISVWPFYLMTAIGSAVLPAEFLIQCAGSIRTVLREMPSASRREIGVILAAFIVLAGVGAWVVLGDLERLTYGILAVVFLLGFIMSGMHITVAMALIGVVAIWLIRDNPTVALRSFKTAATGTINKFDFGVVPLFVLMGLLTDVAGIGRDAYRVAAWWTRKLFGGLGIATVVANALFAAVTGISIASAAIFSRLAVPQMLQHGYTARFASGAVAGSSVLGMLIPPSLLLIIYGFVTESSIGQLFLAAVVPGVILAILFCLVIVLMAKFRPGFVGDISAADDIQEETLVSSALLLLPISLLVLVVLGGIYLGWFTATQAGAVGSLAAFVIAIARRTISIASLRRILLETGQISVSVLALVIGASLLTKALVMSTLTSQMVEFVTDSGFGFWGLLGAYLLIVVIMGMFLDSTSIIVITVPLVLPLVVNLGGAIIGPDVVIWFGIVSVVAVELGLLTPPFGITVFVVKAAIGNVCSLAEVFLGALPFVFAMLVLIVLMLLFPSLVVGLL